MKECFDYIYSTLLSTYGPDEALELTYWILEESTSMSRYEIMGCKGTINIPNIEIILQRLLKKEPIQYIFGHTQWMGLDIKVTPATLIPRPETAELVELVEQYCHDSKLRIMDIGTGSGCIAIALKSRHPNWELTAIDSSEKALSIAKENALANHVNITFKKVDILSDEIECFDCIVSNPPYVMEKEKATMDERVLHYEPVQALFVSDNDPLVFYHRIANMRKGQRLFMEINEQFGTEVAQLMEQAGYTDVTIKEDIYGKQRMVCGRIKE